MTARHPTTLRTSALSNAPIVPFVTLVPMLLATALATGCDYDRKLPGESNAPRTPEASADVVAPTDPNPPTPDDPPEVTDPPTPDAVAPPTEPDTVAPTPDPWVHPVIVEVDEGTREEVPLDPLAPVTPPPNRGRQRMDIDQLDRAFQTVLGGVTWTHRTGATDVNQFQALSETLGVPDFIDTTFEDLGPTPLFQKFLNDAARKACADRLAADLALAADAGAEASGSGPILFGALPPTATLASHPDDIEAQLAALLLRFHGRRVAPGAPSFGEWRWLFESSTQLSGDPKVAWQALCVALITHPDFYTY